MPRVGEIVNFVLGADANRMREIRPAIIVRVWSEVCVNLQVFTDGRNDYPEYYEDAHWKTSIVYNADHLPETWHYPGAEATDKQAAAA